MTDQRCLLVGCGHRGRTHAAALAASERLEFAAVCDRNRENAEAVATELDVPAVYTDLRDALESERPEHVSAVTAPSTRLDVVRAVLEYEPTSLLIEKPVANTLDEVEAVAALAADSRTLMTVCHQKPYADEFAAVKGWIDGGRLGEIERLVGSTKGGLTGQGTHFLHALDWFVGATPAAVRGFAEGPASLDPARNPRVADHAEPEDAVLELSYPDDVRGFVHLGPGAPDVEAQAGTYWYEFRIDVVGTDGRAELVLGDHAKGVFADGTAHEPARDFEEDAYMTRALYDDLAAVLDGETDDHLADLDSAVAVHRVVDAAMRSALDGRSVSPAERPLDVGRPTTERLRRRLAGRRPVCVSTSLFGDRSLATALDALADLGVSRADLWAGPDGASHVDPATDDPDEVRAALDARGMSAPVVSVGTDDVASRVRFASALGAETVVVGSRPGEDPVERDALRSWLDVAADRDLTGAVVPGFDAPASPGALVDFLAELDRPAARLAVAPPPVVRAGESPEALLARLGHRVAAVYLWDTDPAGTRAAPGEWWERPDSQVPGGGASVEFDRLLAAAVEHAPTAEWVLRYHGVGDWHDDRTRGSIARALRVVERARP